MFSYNNLLIKSIYATIPTSKKDIRSVFTSRFGEDKINKFINNVGIKELRVTNEFTTSVDLAFQSAKSMIADLKIDKNEIGFLIFVSQTPDYLLPSSSFVIHNRLGLGKSCVVFDINLGCSGYVSSLNTLFSLMEFSSYKYGLLLTGDTISKIIDSNDSSTAMLFGDAGTATLIEKTIEISNSVFSIETLSEKYDQIIVKDGLFKSTGSMILYMNGIEVFNFAINDVSKSIKNHISANLTNYQIYDYFIPHQANLFMLNQLKKSLKIDSEMISSLDRFGNTSVSSIPLTIASYNRNNLLNKKILLSGFGVGFSIANASLETKELFTKVIEI
jgi:3-oxoacyl-[acyl-carrier-protein] synthase-3